MLAGELAHAEVEVAVEEDVGARLGQRLRSVEAAAMPEAKASARSPPLERGEGRLEPGLGRIPLADVEPAVERLGGRAVEEGGREVDRRRHRAGVRVGLAAGVDGERSRSACAELSVGTSPGTRRRARVGSGRSRTAYEALPAPSPSSAELLEQRRS